jgi:hypothetical protein
MGIPAVGTRSAEATAGHREPQTIADTFLRSSIANCQIKSDQRFL